MHCCKVHPLKHPGHHFQKKMVEFANKSACMALCHCRCSPSRNLFHRISKRGEFAAFQLGCTQVALLEAATFKLQAIVVSQYMDMGGKDIEDASSACHPQTVNVCVSTCFDPKMVLGFGSKNGCYSCTGKNSGKFWVCLLHGIFQPQLWTIQSTLVDS